jgi:HK97 family phage portal protein
MNNWLSEAASKIFNRDREPISLRLEAPPHQQSEQVKTFSEPPFWARNLDISRLLPRTKFDYATEIGDGLRSSVFMAPVAWIQRTFPEAVVELVKSGGKEEEILQDHDVIKLLKRPNDFYTGSALWAATLYSFVFDGNGYWLKLRDQATRRQIPWNENITGNVRQFRYVPHWLMEPMTRQGTSDFISYYQYRIGGIPIEVAPQNVVHFRNGLDPRNPRKGLSQIASELREIFVDEEVSNFVAALLKNMGVPGLVMTPDFAGLAALGAGSMEFDAVAAKEKLKETLTGDKRGEPFVSSKPVKLQQFGFSPTAMQITQLRDVSEERVCARLGIPAAVVGFGAGIDATKVGATMTEMVGLAWKGCLIPMQTSMAEQLTLSIVPDFEPEPGNFALRFNQKNVAALQGNKKEIADAMDVGIKGGWIEVAEGRAALGLEVRPQDHIYLRGIQTIEVEAGTSNPPQPAPKQRALPGLKATRPTREQRKFMAALTRNALSLETEFDGELRKFFDRTGQLFEAATLTVLNRQAKSEDDDAREIFDAIDINALKEELGQIMGAHYFEVTKSTYAAMREIMGLAVDLPAEREALIMELGGRRAGLTDLDGSLKQRLFKELAEGRDAGEGPVDLARRIRNTVPAGTWSTPEVRARVIARTETINAQRASVLEGAKDAENVDMVMVFDGRLETSDDDCIARDGSIVSFDDAEAMMADEHPNGTLNFAPVVN